MRIDAIASFQKLVETGSYAAAAEALFMSPTTLQSHIKSVENELGTPIVRFASRKLVLTHAGTLFLVFAERTLGDYEQLQGAISELGSTPRNHLRIAALGAAAVHLAPPVIHRFKTRRPDIVISVETGRVGGVLAALVGGEADLAIVQDLHAELTHGMFISTQILEDDLIMIVRRDLYREPVEKLLSTYPFAVQTPTSLSRHYVERWARTQGIHLNVAIEHSSFDGIIASVLEGACIGIVGGYVLARNPAAPFLRVLDLPTFTCVRKVVALRSSTADPVVTDFVSALVEYHSPSLRD
jgi:DNA-binding transcriptional LysR family regulator